MFSLSAKNCARDKFDLALVLPNSPRSAIEPGSPEFRSASATRVRGGIFS